MIKFWVYLVILVLIAACGLALGAANGTMVRFDFLFMVEELSLASVLVIGTGIGFVVGLYVSILLCFSLWRQASAARAEARELRLQLQQQDAASAEGSGTPALPEAAAEQNQDTAVVAAEPDKEKPKAEAGVAASAG